MWCLVEDEKLIEIKILIPVGMEKRKPEPEPEEGTGWQEASVVGMPVREKTDRQRSEGGLQAPFRAMGKGREGGPCLKRSQGDGEGRRDRAAQAGKKGPDLGAFAIPASALDSSLFAQRRPNDTFPSIVFECRMSGWIPIHRPRESRG